MLERIERVDDFEDLRRRKQSWLVEVYRLESDLSLKPESVSSRLGLNDIRPIYIDSANRDTQLCRQTASKGSLTTPDVERARTGLDSGTKARNHLIECHQAFLSKILLAKNWLVSNSK